MNGSAPYWSATGSQVPDTRNRAPNFRSAGNDSRSRTAKRSTVRASTMKAKNADAFSNAWSLGFLPVLSDIPGWFPYSMRREGGDSSPPFRLHDMAGRAAGGGPAAQYSDFPPWV